MRDRRIDLNSQQGDGLIEGVLMIGLVLLVVGVGVQALLYAHARSVAAGAAQDGARAAAAGGPGAGVARAGAVLAASGGVGQRLHPGANRGASSVTVTVEGRTPKVFPLPGALVGVKASATLPLEQYPVEERAP